MIELSFKLFANAQDDPGKQLLFLATAVAGGCILSCFLIYVLFEERITAWFLKNIGKYLKQNEVRTLAKSQQSLWRLWRSLRKRPVPHTLTHLPAHSSSAQLPVPDPDFDDFREQVLTAGLESLQPAAGEVHPGEGEQANKGAGGGGGKQRITGGKEKRKNS